MLGNDAKDIIMLKQTNFRTKGVSKLNENDFGVDHVLASKYNNFGAILC
jgi:hypothetical protein